MKTTNKTKKEGQKMIKSGDIYKGFGMMDGKVIMIDRVINKVVHWLDISWNVVCKATVEEFKTYSFVKDGRD